MFKLILASLNFLRITRDRIGPLKTLRTEDRASICSHPTMVEFQSESSPLELENDRVKVSYQFPSILFIVSAENSALNAPGNK